MCGINGITKANETLVSKMNLATKHRGPDGSSVYQVSSSTLGHNRLAIIDLSSRSNQPMVSQDGRYVIVFNGEIYNFKELREELKATYQFKTEGDTEVLLAAYITWGQAALSRLRGIFAFAVLDQNDNSIVLVRDHAGVKPLYYALSDNGLVFSSELEGMIAAGFTALSRDMVALYLSMQYVPSPYTIIEKVKKLQPGEVLTYRAGVSSVVQYDTSTIAVSEAAKGKTYDVLTDAVSHQLISDREVGLFLSGGLDSSIVLHHAAAAMADIKTFSLGFELDDNSEENQAKFNFDSLTAEKTAAHYGVRHTLFTLSHADVASRLEDVLASLDEPVANPTAFTKYMLSEWVRGEGIVVALGGDGGDEVFKGYPRYRAALVAEYFQSLPKALQSAIGELYPRAKKLSSPLGPTFHARLVTNSTRFPSIIKHSFDTVSFAEGMLAEKYQLYAKDLKGVRGFIAADSHLWLPDESLHSTDRATMAHGLEYRVPFLDQLVLSHAASIPLHKNLSPRLGKKVLRNVYRDVLPAHLFVRKKRGWLSPAAKWFRDKRINDQLNQVMSTGYSSTLSDMIDWEQARGLLAEHVAGDTYAVNPIWNLVQLQVWAKAKGLHL